MILARARPACSMDENGSGCPQTTFARLHCFRTSDGSVLDGERRRLFHVYSGSIVTVPPKMAFGV
jgi:hypothetical protein